MRVRDTLLSPAVVLGEVLCDLFASRAGVPLAEADTLLPRPGGAPANVSVQLCRLGHRVELVSAIGDDPLGERVLSQLAGEGVGVAHVTRQPGRRTGITLVEVDGAGERSFFPWRENSADQRLCEAMLPAALLDETPLLHRGTVTLRKEPARSATRAAVHRARAAGAIVSLDVNLRFRMFPSRERLCALARTAVREAHVVKATLEEASAMYGPHPAEGLADLALRAGAYLVLLTDGERGALLASRAARVFVPAPRVTVVDATGAGDAFCGAALAWLLAARARPGDVAALDEASLKDLGEKAAHAGAAAVTRLGATAGMVRSLSGANARRRRTPTAPLAS